MNAEYVLNNIKSMMETYLTAMLRTIEIESSAVDQTTNPSKYFIGNRDLDIIDTFPAILIYGKNSSDNDDELGYQDRLLRYEVVSWIVENDQENLHRFILRYGDAITKILRKESYWENNLHNPVIKMCTYTDLFKSNIGYAQGCMVQGEIQYIIS